MKVECLIKKEKEKIREWLENSQHHSDDFKKFSLQKTFFNINGTILLIALITLLITFFIMLLSPVFTYLPFMISLILFSSSSITAFILKRKQFSLLKKVLPTYLEATSSPFLEDEGKATNELYEKKYRSKKTYKFGVIYSLVAHSFLLVLFSILSIFSYGFTSIPIIIPIAIAGFIFLINFDFYLVYPHKFVYILGHLIVSGLLGGLMGFDIKKLYGIDLIGLLIFLIVILYYFVSDWIYLQVKLKMEKEVISSIIPDLNKHFEFKSEIDLKNWEWFSPCDEILEVRYSIIKRAIEHAAIKNIDLKENKLIKIS